MLLIDGVYTVCIGLSILYLVHVCLDLGEIVFENVNFAFRLRLLWNLQSATAQQYNC